MATDIQISQLNEVSCNNDLNHIIINDRESASDDGITKKIQLCNFLTPNLVKETNIIDSAVTRDKIAPLSVDCSRIANNTITCNQIAQCGIANYNFDSNSVDNRALNNCCGFTVKCLTVNGGPVNISHPINGCLAVESGVTKLNNITYNWPTAQIANRFLKTNGAGGLSWEEAVPGESTSLVFSEIMPVGTIVPWAGVGSVPDDKWLECDGGTFKGTDYPELCATLGNTWGDPIDGLYYLPDLVGRVVIGAGIGSDGNNDTCTFGFACMGGEYRHTLNNSEMQHRHVTGSFTSNGNDDYRPYLASNSGVLYNSITYCSRWIAGEGNNTNYGSVAADTAAKQTQTTALYDPDMVTATGHNNIQPYTVTRYIIKAKPDDVEQFNPTIGPGLSAADNGGQTANITLTSTQIGLKVSNDFQFDGGSRLEINDTWKNENIDRGRPLQYVNNHINTTHRYNKTADTDLHVTQLDTAVTLKDTTSKVYITAMITAESYTHNGVWKLFRKVGAVETEIGSNIETSGNNRRGIATGMYDGNDESTPCNVYIQYMDTPASIDVTYIFKWNSDGTGNNLFTLNGSRTTYTYEDYEQASSNVNLVEIGG